MPLLQHLFYLMQAVAFCRKQDHVVVKQICGFSEKKFFVFIFCFDDQFHRFLSYFLGDFVDSFVKKF